MAQSPLEDTDKEDTDTPQSSVVSSLERRKPYWIMVSAQVLEPHSLALTPDRVSHVKTWAGNIISLKAQYFLWNMGILTVVLLPHGTLGRTK